MRSGVPGDNTTVTSPAPAIATSSGINGACCAANVKDMEMQEGFRPSDAPISAALYSRFEHQREEIRSLRRDAAAAHGEDLDAYKRAVILEAEVTAVWNVFDAVLAAIHEIETGRPLEGWLVDDERPPA